MADGDRSGEDGAAPAVDVLAELTAMQAVAAALEALGPDERRRVLRWATDRYVGRATPRPASAPPASSPAPSVELPGEAEPPLSGVAGPLEPIRPEPSRMTGGGDGPSSAVERPATSAELLAAANARTDAQRVLAISYWFQVCEGQPDLDAMTLNRELKNLGHGVTNITGVLSRLMEGRPQLVLQLKKSGSSRQARKKYKLTQAGRQRAEAMLGGAAPPGEGDDA